VGSRKGFVLPSKRAGGMKAYDKNALIVFAALAFAGLISALFVYWFSGSWELSLVIMIGCLFSGISNAAAKKVHSKWKPKGPFG